MTDNRTVAEKAEVALRMVGEAKEIVYDTETTGVDWKKHSPVGYVIGTNLHDVVYVPVRHGGGGNLPDPNVKPLGTPTDPIIQHRFEKALNDVLLARSHKPKFIGHHIKFDCHMSANAGIMLGRNMACTQNTATMLDENSRSFSLENCAKERKIPAKKGAEMYEYLSRMFGCAPDKKSMAYFWELAGDDPMANEYAVGDGVTTLALHHAQLKDIAEEDMSVVYQLECDLIWTLFRMERRGIKVDEDYLQELLGAIELELGQATKALPPGFNVRSPNDMKAYLEEHGATDWPLTEKGNPSFTEKWLKSFDAGQPIVAIRKLTNLRNTFAQPLLEEHIHNGRVHAQLNQLRNDDNGTPARLSCSHPNLQAIPKRDKVLAPKFRKAFVADEGMVFYEEDWSQCEPRLFAHYSGEPVLVEGYSKAPFRDMHQVVADLLEVERDPTAKRMNMGLLTGMYPKAFAGHMGTSIGEATVMWNQWDAAFPNIKAFRETAKRVIMQRGYVKTLLGRRGRLEHPRFAYKATSKIIQGSNADIIKYMLVKIDKELEAQGDLVQLLMSVHDSFEWQAPDTPEGEAVSKWITEETIKVQCKPFNLKVPFAADVGFGKNWAEASFGKED